MMEIRPPSSSASKSSTGTLTSMRKRPRSWSMIMSSRSHRPQASDQGKPTSSLAARSASEATATTTTTTTKTTTIITKSAARDVHEGSNWHHDRCCCSSSCSCCCDDRRSRNRYYPRRRYNRNSRISSSSVLISRTTPFVPRTVMIKYMVVAVKVKVIRLILILCLTFHYTMTTVAQQFTNFEPSTISCPADPAITGYTSIESINGDIETERIRIEGGGTPEEFYNLILCPETTFDTSQGPLQPALDQLTISCGGDGEVGNNCILSGGPTNILIADPSAPVDGYEIDVLNFVGLTFTAFTDWSIDITTSSSSGTATFTDCLWQDFTTTTGGIARMNTANGNDDVPMSLVFDKSTIQSSSSTSSDASLAMGFENTGGSIELKNAVIQNIQVITTLFQTTGGGTTTMSSSSISNSVLPAMSNVNVGSSTFSNVTIADNTEVVRMFAASGGGSFVNLDQSTIIERNTGANPFQIVRITDGAVGEIRRVDIRSNDPVEYGIYVLVETDGTTPTATIEDTVFEGNTQEDWSLVMSEGSGASVSMARNDFIDNSGGLMNIGAFFGGNVRFTQTCFVRNTHFLVALILELSTFEAFENYVEDEVSQICSGTNEDEGPGRLSVEQPGSMCFRGGEECLVDCLPNANDSPVCLSQVVPPTIAPTEPVTGVPEPTDPPTDPLPTELPAPTPSPTEPAIPPQSPPPTDPSNPPGPTWAPLIPVPPGPPRPPPTRAPSMSSRVPTRPPSKPSRVPTRPPSRHTRQPTRQPTGPPQHPPRYESSKSEKSSKKDKSSNKSKGKNSKKSKSQKSTVRPNNHYGIGNMEEFYGIGNTRPVISPTPSNGGINAEDENNDEDRKNNIISNQANSNFFFGTSHRPWRNKKKIEKARPIVLRGIGTGE